MGFFARRKTLRDQDAGLVFGWREGQGSFGTFFLASLVTGVVASFCIYAVRVPLEASEALLRQSGQAVTLIEVSGEKGGGLADWDGGVTEQELMLLVDQQTRYFPRAEGQLRPLPDIRKEAELPSLAKGTSLSLPAVPRSLQSLPVMPSGGVKLRITATDGFENRLPAGGVNKDLAIDPWRKSVGQTARCLVQVLSGGAIDSVWMLDEGTAELREEVLSWLPLQTFLPSEGGEDRWMEVTLTVEAL